MLFLLTRPEWGATCFGFPVVRRKVISTHTPRVGRNLQQAIIAHITTDFYSHAPSGAQRISAMQRRKSLRISTHTPRVGRNYVQPYIYTQYIYNFYSHAPSGAQPSPVGSSTGRKDFYSHAPSGAQRRRRCEGAGAVRFLLTRPEWGATTVSVPLSESLSFLLTRPEWGATCTAQQ